MLEEASFLVVESGRIRFFVHPRFAAAAPTSLGDVERVSFTLAPRNRSVARRVSLSERQMPDDRGGERVTAHVDRVGAPEPDAGPRRSRRARGARERAGAIEVARGTYAITSHRDHAHLMYELDGESAVSYAALLHLLRVAPRASYVALVQNPESRWRVRDREQGPAPSSGARPRGGSAGRMDDDLDKRRFMPLDPVFLDHEGTELVLLGGRVVVGREPRDACGRP
ncbi:MAG: hypothetical protein KIS78_28055 [Labilithrix sp.]|nr:hypothetical protein [Labilithrix sp.]